MSLADRGERLARYQSARTVPLLVAGFLYLGSFIALRVDGEPTTSFLFFASWVAFMVDYVIQLALAPRKWRFVVEHPLYLLSLVFPPVRVWLLVTVSIRFVRNDKKSLKDRVGLASLVVVGMIIIFGGLLTLILEIGQSGATIETYGESLWWASVTLTSVGYGDFVPVTGAGRFVGTLVFSTGVAVLAVVTATVVSWFTPTKPGRQPSTSDVSDFSDDADPPSTPDVPQSRGDRSPVGTSVNDEPHLATVMAKLEEISNRLGAIEKAAHDGPGAASPTLSEESRTVETDGGSAEPLSPGTAQ